MADCLYVHITNAWVHRGDPFWAVPAADPVTSLDADPPPLPAGVTVTAPAGPAADEPVVVTHR